MPCMPCSTNGRRALLALMQCEPESTLRVPTPALLQVLPLLQRHSANFSRDIVVYNFG